MSDKTITFSISEEREKEMLQTLRTVYDALNEKGYNPINQIVGYILSEDPTYITVHKNARSLIRHIDRDELMQVLVRISNCKKALRRINPQSFSVYNPYFF